MAVIKQHDGTGSATAYVTVLIRTRITQGRDKDDIAVDNKPLGIVSNIDEVKELVRKDVPENAGELFQSPVDNPLSYVAWTEPNAFGVSYNYECISLKLNILTEIK